MLHDECLIGFRPAEPELTAWVRPLFLNRFAFHSYLVVTPLCRFLSWDHMNVYVLGGGVSKTVAYPVGTQLFDEIDRYVRASGPLIDR
jgi:hypothetical protein